MIPTPPISNPTYTLFPYPTLSRSYFTYYETETQQVLSSPVYLVRLENPTERTRAVMPFFTNASRTVCGLSARFGDSMGAKAATFHWRDTGADIRSEERRVGKECVSTCRSRWSPDH